MAVALPNDRLLVANKAPCSGTVCTDVARVAAGGASVSIIGNGHREATRVAARAVLWRLDRSSTETADGWRLG